MTCFIPLTKTRQLLTTDPIQDAGLLAMPTSNTPPAGGSGGRGDLTPEEREAFKQRADELGKRLGAAKSHGAAAKASATGNPAGNATALGQAMQISTLLIVSIVVGCGLGWAVDTWLKTWPSGFVAGFVLGAAAGLYGVVRAGMAMKTGPSNPKAGPSVQDDEEA